MIAVEDVSSLKLRERFYLSAKYGDPFLINTNIQDGDNLNEERKLAKHHAKIVMPKKGRPIFFKKVINLDTGEVFNSTSEISAKTGLPARYYNRRINGERVNNTPYRYIEGERFAVYK